MAIPEKLINEHFDNLTQEEIALVKKAPVYAEWILSVEEDLKRPGQLIRHHLERFDGKGFPDGLKRDEIPIGSRIIGAVNAYDEMKVRRRFTKEEFSTEKQEEDFAMHRLKKLSINASDFNVVDILINVIIETFTKKESQVLSKIVDLKPGMKLVEDIRTKDGKLLVPKYYRLTSAVISKHIDFRKANLIETSARIDKFIR